MEQQEGAKTDALDLAYLLTMLDGLESAEGRCIVASTNCPDRIDPSLLRPGRFGVHLNLNRATHQMLADILSMTYKLAGKERKKLRKDLRQVPEFIWSPTELIQLSIMNASIHDCVTHLRTKTPTA